MAGALPAAAAVLVAPPLKTERSTPCPWYQPYQPQDLRVIDNCAGNCQQFVAMIAALRRNGVSTYADVVLTHDLPNNDPFRSLILDPGDEDLAHAYSRGLWAVE